MCVLGRLRRRISIARQAPLPLIRRVRGKPTNVVLALSLVFAVFLWGGTNAGTKYVVSAWPPLWTGGSRFLCAGVILLGILRFTTLLGPRQPMPSGMGGQLWWRGGLSLAVYITVFNLALCYTAASHVALYLGAAPVWAVLWEGPHGRSWGTARRYAAAFIGLCGVVALFWPSLKGTHADWRGEALGLVASVLWTNYGRQCRHLSAHLGGAQVSAHTMWRAGAILLPLSLGELARAGLEIRISLVLVQTYCILAGGVTAFAIWNISLRHWPTSKVLLFNNLIPLSTTTWAHACLSEPITSTFWVAMFLVVAGVLLGQTNWERFLAPRSVPAD